MKTTWRTQTARACTGLAMAAAAIPAAAFELVNDADHSVRLDTNLAYTFGVRTARPQPAFTQSPLGIFDDGDAAFRRGDPVFNRADVSVELDAALKDRYKTGVRASVLGWYDQVYNRTHEPVNPATYNAVSVDNTHFTRTARRMAGRDLELYDLFVHGGFDLGATPVSYRLGRHTLLWGESLFFANNGIAAGQAPINAIKALSVPIIAAKEVFKPVNQLSGSVGMNDHVNLQGYYQLEYRETDVSPPGTYFSPMDAAYQGAETFFGMRRGADIRPPRARGQWGLAAKFSYPEKDVDGGVYYTRYAAKTPQIYADLANGAFRFVYPRNVESLGASLSSTVGDANVAGEASYRRNLPLINGGMPAAANLDASRADQAALHAVGETFHLQASTIWVLPRNPVFPASTLMAEIAGHHLVKVTANPGMLLQGGSKNMVGVALNFVPTYYRLLGDADVDFPVSFTYNLSSRQSVVDGTGGHAGKVGVGMTLKYGQSWRAGISYTKFVGANNPGANPFSDRDFVAFNLNYSF